MIFFFAFTALIFRKAQFLSFLLLLFSLTLFPARGGGGKVMDTFRPSPCKTDEKCNNANHQNIAKLLGWFVLFSQGMAMELREVGDDPSWAIKSSGVLPSPARDHKSGENGYPPPQIQATCPLNLGFTGQAERKFGPSSQQKKSLFPIKNVAFFFWRKMLAFEPKNEQ